MATSVKPFGSAPANACGYMGGRYFSRLSWTSAGLARFAVGLCCSCSMQHEHARGARSSVKEPLSTPFRNHSHEDKALQYKELLISKVGSAEHPTSLHRQLFMVDVLEKMGISRHFSGLIKSILDMAYSQWLQKEGEIMLSMATCAMAFRILRMNGYDVSADELSHHLESFGFLNSPEQYSTDDIRSVLELYKASKVTISEDEFILESIGSWLGCLMNEQLRPFSTAPLLREVEYALSCPFYATLDRLDHRWNIEHYFDVTGHQLVETLYLPFQMKEYILALAVSDFSTSQSIYQQELQYLGRWVKDNKLDQLPFARQKLAYFYLSAAGTIFPPEMSDARIFWAQNGVLTTVVDDFFDVGGSMEELESLVKLVERWDDHHKTEFYSEQVEIVFSAIYTSVNQLGAKASALQGRDVTKHIVQIWLDLLRSMMTEVEWRMNKYVPSTEEYIANAALTFALGPIVLPALYFVGPKISESVVRDPEYNELFRQMSICGRLLNDIQGYEREYKEGKLNSVSLLALQSGGSMSIQEARKEIQKPIDACRRDLLRLVLRKDGVVPGPCKELFWNMCKVCHFFYSRTDGFSSSVEKAGEVNAVINDPLQLQLDASLNRNCRVE